MLGEFWVYQQNAVGQSGHVVKKGRWSGEAPGTQMQKLTTSAQKCVCKTCAHERLCSVVRNGNIYLSAHTHVYTEHMACAQRSLGAHVLKQPRCPSVQQTWHRHVAGTSQVTACHCCDERDPGDESAELGYSGASQDTLQDTRQL